MGVTVRYVLGIGTLIGVAALTVYAVKKSMDLKKEEENAISVEEAMAEVEAYRESIHTEQVEELLDEEIDFEQMKDDEVSWNMSFDESRINEDFEEEDEEMYESMGNIEGPSIDESVLSQNSNYDTITEEDRKLRYEPNSFEARQQFIRMELADWTPNDDTYHTMVKLFDFPVHAVNDGDHILLTQIIDYRVKFFGFSSKWVKEITMADVILHYARGAHFNVDETVRYWVEYFLEFNELHHTIPSHELDETIHKLNNHTYYNKDTGTHGLFGLTPEGIENAISIAGRNIDKCLTYEIEFNEFLKACV